MQHMSLEKYLLLDTNSDRRSEFYDGEVSLLADHRTMLQSRSTSG
jgi:hypothetical protein